ncbi:hypothetical protein FB451DRAFT_1044888 [Mycena latifolia]|nr:hypothetical protein FB451DRAFT_1044888 [Mycena latifolia]
MQIKFSSLVVASIFLVAEVTAWPAPSRPGGLDPLGNMFIAAKRTDSRSPCPGLNTRVLANHGYLPRNGSNFTIPQLMDAALSAWMHID